MSSTAKIRRFMSQLEAKGGGDWFEAIDAGIKDAQKGLDMNRRKTAHYCGR